MTNENQKRTTTEYLRGHKEIWPDCEECGEPSHKCKCDKPEKGKSDG